MMEVQFCFAGAHIENWFAFKRKKSRSYCNTSQPTAWRKRVITTVSPVIKKNCSKLFQGDVDEISSVQKELKKWKGSLSDAQSIIQLTNCSFVRDEFLYSYYVSLLEEEFPIAYILVVYTNPQQIIRFLKAVYRPHNVYCIHPDPKSGHEFALYFHLLSTCLSNVFVASKLTSVFFAYDSSTLDAQLNCYSDLLKLNVGWHYVINLCGRDLPLRTNREIVKMLTFFNGSSIIAPFKLNMATMRYRFLNSKVRMANSKAPHGIELYKSSSYNALSRKFVTFLLTNQTSIDFYHWIHYARVPEEHFYPSMYMYMLSDAHHLHNNRRIGWHGGIVAAQWIWKRKEPLNEHCDGKVIHHICIISSADLHLVQRSIKSNIYLFFNKYFMEEDHLVMDCMEERLIQQNKLEYLRDCT